MNSFKKITDIKPRKLNEKRRFPFTADVMYWAATARTQNQFIISHEKLISGNKDRYVCVCVCVCERESVCVRASYGSLKVNSLQIVSWERQNDKKEKYCCSKV